MASTPLDTQVVVVGAGPVGLMLAGELRLGGADVVVLEQRTAPTTESRASTLHARTMEILDSRGLLDAVGVPPNQPRGHFGGIPLDLTLPSPYPGQWKVPQTKVEEVLGAWAVSSGADVRRGHTVCGLTVEDDHVEVEAATSSGTVRLRALCVVACDGERSTVRRLTGARFPGADASRELLRADVAGIEVPDRRFERLERGLAIAARRPDGVTRVMVHEFGSVARERGEEPSFEEFARTWERVTGEDIGHGTPLWVNSFGDASRQLERYRDGRVLYAGDAAHQQMPIGGQALNLGLQDAYNLGWKLAVQVSRRASEGLLDSYHDERHPVGRRTLANIRAQATLLLGGPEAEDLRGVIDEMIGLPDGRARLAGMISGLDVRYEVGGGEHPLLGARLPELRLETAPGSTTTTTALLRTGRGLLLDLSGDDDRFARLRETAADWTDRVTAVAARPADTDGPDPLAGADTVLVRPDGHVVSAGTDTDGLVPVLRRWFGLPASEPTPPAAAAAQTATPTTSVTERRNDMGRLTGKTALVTGSSRGMGRATALRLAADGALVAVHYARGKEEAEDVVATIEKDGGRAFTVRAELGVPGDVHELFLGLEEGLRERTGSTALDILVNNAGVMGGVKPEETTPDRFDEIFAVNAKAPFFLIQRALKNLRDGGRIINISSGLTRFANPDEIAYAMAKGAVEQLALHFAKYLGPRRITINSVAPGITRNGSPVFDIPEAVEQMAAMSAFNRVGEPEDVADVVAFLASDDARWITGSFVDATGGTLLG
ncbi:SDR family oxidoreductase [Streptomyces fragilis]|uniref:SDR family oxidoreductase n=1 Tax=Streptomyces fragilis TaxID=67301 RepID=A0ABV2YF04_9ACTN|nr:SDR family oxidoreductase [Streptomyces fragilis]